MREIFGYLNSLLEPKPSPVSASAKDALMPCTSGLDCARGLSMRSTTVMALKKVKAMTVVERMDNPLAQSNPLVQGIKASFADALTGLGFGSNSEFKYPKISRIPRIYACSAG